MFLGREEQDDGTLCEIAAWTSLEVMEEQSGDDDVVQQTAWLPDAIVTSVARAAESGWTDAIEVPLSDGTRLSVVPSVTNQLFQSLVVLEAA